MSERKFRPFPQIPRFPAEAASLSDEAVPAEEPLEGAPTSAESSLLLSIPALAATANTAVEYVSAKSDVRRRTADQYAATFVMNPDAFTATEDALAMLEASQGNPVADQLRSDEDALAILEEGKAYPAAATLRTDINKGLERVRPQGVPTPEVAQQWLTLLVESPLYSPAAEKVLSRFIERCKTTKEIVDFVYQLALGGFSSSNPEVVNRTLEIIGFQTPILTPESPQAALHILSMFDADDTTLRKAMEIDGTFFYLMHHLHPELIPKLDASQDAILERPEYLTAHKAVMAANPTRYKQIIQHLQRKTSAEGILEYQVGERVPVFPLNLATQNIGPLRKLLNEKLAENIQRAHEDGFSAVLDLPSMAGVRRADTLSELGKIILSELLEDRGELVCMEAPDHLRTLSYLVPPEMDSRTEWNDITNANQQLRREMVENSRYLLSPRGDQIEITDPMLRMLGFNAITYQMNPANRRETVVTVSVGNQCEYRAILDEYFTLRDVHEHKSIQLPQHGAFLENILLSHLREIRCSERVNEVTSGTPTVPGEKRRAFTSRRAHRRILPERHSPTADQIVRIQEEYDVDLVRLNREREAAGESRKVTYVYEVDNIAIAGVGPVRSRTPEATRRLQELLALQPVVEAAPTA